MIWKCMCKHKYTENKQNVMIMGLCDYIIKIIIQ
jgi:hypothetical protein